jgi:hypothetical protein
LHPVPEPGSQSCAWPLAQSVSHWVLAPPPPPALPRLAQQISVDPQLVAVHPIGMPPSAHSLLSATQVPERPPPPAAPLAQQTGVAPEHVVEPAPPPGGHGTPPPVPGESPAFGESPGASLPPPLPSLVTPVSAPPPSSRLASFPPPSSPPPPPTLLVLPPHAATMTALVTPRIDQSLIEGTSRCTIQLEN